MDIQDLEDALADILPGCSFGTDNSGQLIIYTGLIEDEDGELSDFESDDVDTDSDPDFEPLEDDDPDEL